MSAISECLSDDEVKKEHFSSKKRRFGVLKIMKKNGQKTNPREKSLNKFVYTISGPNGITFEYFLAKSISNVYINFVLDSIMCGIISFDEKQSDILIENSFTRKLIRKFKKTLDEKKILLESENMTIESINLWSIKLKELLSTCLEDQLEDLFDIHKKFKKSKSMVEITLKSFKEPIWKSI